MGKETARVRGPTATTLHVSRVTTFLAIASHSKSFKRKRKWLLWALTKWKFLRIYQICTRFSFGTVIDVIYIISCIVLYCIALSRESEEERGWRSGKRFSQWGGKSVAQDLQFQTHCVGKLLQISHSLFCIRGSPGLPSMLGETMLVVASQCYQHWGDLFLFQRMWRQMLQSGGLKSILHQDTGKQDTPKCWWVKLRRILF